MGETRKSEAGKSVPWAAILTFLGVVIPAYFTYATVRSQVLIPLQATQTAEAATQARATAPVDVPASATAALPPLSAITVTVMHEGCSDVDYYVDNQLLARVGAGGSAAFEVAPGQHDTRVCLLGTNNCAADVPQNWTGSTTVTISRNPRCPVTITLKNENCFDQDYYVDGKVVVQVAAGATAKFQVTPGQHKVQACTTGTENCGSEAELNWPQSTTTSISPNPSCP